MVDILILLLKWILSIVGGILFFVLIFYLDRIPLAITRSRVGDAIKDIQQIGPLYCISRLTDFAPKDYPLTRDDQANVSALMDDYFTDLKDAFFELDANSAKSFYWKDCRWAARNSSCFFIVTLCYYLDERANKNQLCDQRLIGDIEKDQLSPFGVSVQKIYLACLRAIEQNNMPLNKHLHSSSSVRSRLDSNTFRYI